jgi:hypothetical protein
MNWDLVTKYAVPIVGPLAALTAIPIFFWTNFREHARRLAIIDLATKRIAFWNQFLMTANLATAENSPERKAEQDKAYQAILRIHSEALLQTDALVRKKKIGRSVGWRAFKPEIKRLKKWYYVLFWWWWAIMSALMLLVALLLFSGWSTEHSRGGCIKSYPSFF